MKPRVGQTLVSTVDTTTVVVVRWPASEHTLTCGGAPMVESGGAAAGVRGEPGPGQDGGTLLGKRYADELGVELLCTKAGSGTLAVDGVPLPVKAARPLPASD